MLPISEPLAGATPPGDSSRSALDQLALFADVPRAARDALLAVSTEVAFQPGERLVPLFRARPRILFLLSGLAKLAAVSPNGIERIVYVYRRGDVVGSRFLVEAPGDGQEVVAMTPVETLKVERPDFIRVGEAHPEVLLAVTREFTARLERVTGRFLGALTSEVPVRLARLLLDFVQDSDGDSGGFVPIVHPVTHETMAQIVGASRPHVSSVLGHLESAGAVRRLHPRGIEVCPQRLRQIDRAGEFALPE